MLSKKTLEHAEQAMFDCMCTWIERLEYVVKDESDDNKMVHIIDLARVIAKQADGLDEVRDEIGHQYQCQGQPKPKQRHNSN